MKRAANYEEGNRQAAAIILADPDHYAGLPTLWAERWLSRNTTPYCVVSEARELFPRWEKPDERKTA
jgi:hypothetical protein